MPQPVDKRVILKGQKRTCIKCGIKKDLVTDFLYHTFNDAFCKTCEVCKKGSKLKECEERKDAKRQKFATGVLKKCMTCNLEKDEGAHFPYWEKQNRWGKHCNKCLYKREKNVFKRGSQRYKTTHQIKKPYTLEYAAKRVLRINRKTDSSKGYTNDLDLTFILDALQQPCVYCYFPAQNLDRLDNTIGHLKSNCVPCCKECNFTRADRLTYTEMKQLGPVLRKIKIERGIEKQKHFFNLI